MTTTVGVRQLRDHLSQYLGLVRGGEQISVTDRGQEVAIIVPSSSSPLHRKLAELVAAGALLSSGGKPRLPHAVSSPGKPTTSEMVLEDRR